MFCSKCGEELKDTEVYCHKCGAVVKTEGESTTETENAENEKKKGKEWIVGVVFAIFALAVIGTLYMVFLRPNGEEKEVVKVETEAEETQPLAENEETKSEDGQETEISTEDENVAAEDTEETVDGEGEAATMGEDIPVEEGKIIKWYKEESDSNGGSSFDTAEYSFNTLSETVEKKELEGGWSWHMEDDEVVYYRQKSTNQFIKQDKKSGEKTVLIDEDLYIFTPSYRVSEDGKPLLKGMFYEPDPDNLNELYYVDVFTGESRLITDNNHGVVPREIDTGVFLEDENKNVYYTSYDGNYNQVSVAFNVQKWEVIKEGYLVYQTTSNQLYLKNAESGEEILVDTELNREFDFVKGCTLYCKGNTVYLLDELNYPIEIYTASEGEIIGASMGRWEDSDLFDVSINITIRHEEYVEEKAFLYKGGKVMYLMDGNISIHNYSKNENATNELIVISCGEEKSYKDEEAYNDRSYYNSHVRAMLFDIPNDYELGNDIMQYRILDENIKEDEQSVFMGGYEPYYCALTEESAWLVEHVTNEEERYMVLYIYGSGIPRIVYEKKYNSGSENFDFYVDVLCPTGFFGTIGEFGQTKFYSFEDKTETPVFGMIRGIEKLSDEKCLVWADDALYYIYADGNYEKISGTENWMNK